MYSSSSEHRSDVQLHGNSAQVSPKSTPQAENQEPEDEAYRWRPTKPVEKKANTELTPTQLKQALEHEKRQKWRKSWWMNL